jgi:predicted alpha/beta hydrolase family esterase
MKSPCLILAGIGNSGPEHWQSRWQAEDPTIERLEHSEWNAPDCVVWMRELEEALSTVGSKMVLVAHSLACLLVAHWAATSKQRVAGALLVSVPDPAGSTFPAEASNFQRVPQRRLPFPSVVVSSSNDPYGTSQYMRGCASAWGSRFHSVGPLGHINASSNLGAWAEGKSFLHELGA